MVGILGAYVTIKATLATLEDAAEERASVTRSSPPPTATSPASWPASDTGALPEPKLSE
jgi:hypothetical protein